MINILNNFKSQNNSLTMLSKMLPIRKKIILGGITILSIGTAFLEILCATLTLKLSETVLDPTVGNNLLQKINIVTNADSSKAVLYIGGLLCIVYMIKNAYSTFEVFCQNRIVKQLNCDFQNNMLNLFKFVEYEKFISKNSSYPISVVAGDTEIMFSRGVLSLTAISSEIVILTSLMATVIYLDVKFFMIMIIILGMLAISSKKLFFPYFYQLGKDSQDASMEKNKSITTFFQGFKEILLNGKIEYFSDMYVQNLDKSTGVNAMYNIVGTIPRAVIEVTFLVVLVAALYHISSASKVEMLGHLGVYAYAMFRIMPGINKVNNLFGAYSSSIPSIKRFNDLSMELSHKYNYLDIPNFNFKHTISFNNVSFKFKSKQNNILSSIDLVIHKGDFLGIVGGSGAGKSTFLNILLGLLLPQTGSILIDDSYPANCMQWHKRIGYVPQSIYIIDATIAENIAFGETIEEIDFVKLKQVILSVRLVELINSLPEKEHTLVGERGVMFSGGECQRIAIARALYKDPDILIFDEATSSLDEYTESKIVETINSIKDKYTIIMVTHRPRSLKYCNNIIRLCDGKFSEQLILENI